MPTPKLSIIIPCLNESKNIVPTLMALQNLRQRGHEIILCDGGSHDNSIALSLTHVDHCINTPSGRAIQMNAGAEIARGDIFCFLHADTLAPDNIDILILTALHNPLHINSRAWGFFNIKLNNNRWPFRIIEYLINKRSCLSSVATGDQGIFIQKTVFNQLKGFADIALMEDIEISKRLKKTSRPVCIKNHKLITSSRRWEKHGIAATVLLMWRLRLAYFFGVSENKLARAYKNNTSNTSKTKQ